MAARNVAIVTVASFLFLAAPAFVSTYWVGLLTQVLIFGLLAMSLDLLIGYTGLPSFGHAGFFGVAAYAVSVLATKYNANAATCVAMGLVAGVAVSAISGLLVAHVRDVYFLMNTLALGMVLWGVSYRWMPITGGDNGLSGIPRLETEIGLPFAGPAAFFYLTVAVVGLCGVMLRLI